MSTRQESGTVTDSSSKLNRIVVGVDGSTNNRSAVAWAANEAQRAGLELCVVTVSDKRPVRTPQFVNESPEPFDVLVHASRVVEQAADRVKKTHPDLSVSPQLIRNDPLVGMLAETSRASMVVVGKRGVGAVRRLVAGSMSIALAGRSYCPVVVVPDTWQDEPTNHQSILVGVDLGGSTFGLGANSLVRSILHASTRPVAVIPIKHAG